jgi:ABC-type sugar transport system ATPase subunit
VGTKFEIYKLMNELVKTGITIIMISSELPEFVGMCDRAYIMHNGTIVGELGRGELSQENVLQIATGGRKSA